MPSGAFTFLSDLYSGSTSDIDIVKKSGFIDMIEEGDDVIADSGFNIRHLLLPRKATLNIPAFTRGKQLSKKAASHSRRISAMRIHVERAIRRLKTFKILTGVIPLKLWFTLNQTFLIAAVISNLQKRLAWGVEWVVFTLCLALFTLSRRVSQPSLSFLVAVTDDEC